MNSGFEVSVKWMSS